MKSRLRAWLFLLLAIAATAEAVPSSADARVEQALALSYAGKVIDAQRIWRELASEAAARGDATAQDEAERQLADLAFLRGHYAEVAQIHAARLARATASADLKREAEARMQLALVDRRQGHLERARSGLEQALSSFRTTADRNGESEALTHLGLVLINQGAFVRALEALDASLALHRAGASSSVDRTYHYLGLLYLALRDFDEAGSQLQRALEEARKLPDPMRAGAPLGSLARVANEQQAYADALAYAAEARAISERFENAPGLAYSSLERGRALLGLGRLSEARASLEESRSLSASLDQDRTVADATFTLGRVALADNDPGLALNLFEAAIPNYEAAGDVPQLLEAYRIMAPLLRDAGNLPRALDLAMAALPMLEQISGRETSRRIALIEYRHEVEANARHIEQLARDNEIAALRLRQDELGRQLGIGIIGGLVLLALILGWLNQRNKRISASLSASNLALDAHRQELAASHAALAEKAAALQIAATSDALTGLANRRHVLEVLERAVAAAQRTHQRIAVLLIDVDRFKPINDRYGHGAGDRALCRVSGEIQNDLPMGAILGRYGGDEFLLVLPDHDSAGASVWAERTRLAVRSGHADDEPTITLSIGIADRVGNDRFTAADLVDAADRALYRAKRSGRDQVATAMRGGD